MFERVITGMLGTLCTFQKQQSVFPNPENGFKPNRVGILPPPNNSISIQNVRHSNQAQARADRGAEGEDEGWT